MNNENFDLVTNDENEEFTVEFGEVINDGGTHDYDELDNKPQINGHTLEGNKTGEQLGLQDKINDLDTIRSGATKGATAVQPEDLARIATTGSYNDSLNKPSINNVALIGNISLDALGIQPKGNYALESEIPDVSSFITKDVNNLTYYTLKTNTGSLIDLEINDTTYVVTLKLKNQDGTVISTDTIDLPLESVVVSGRYDNTTKKVILTLENGSEVDFSVAELVAGLQTEITSSNKLASDLVDDANSGNKFVTTSEKQTWNNKYDKPNSGIPKTDLASTVQTSLGKADTALQSISSSDVTSALGYTPYNSTNPNGYTSNVGTITGITMNGVSKGTSGVVDLGTVITSHQDISGKLDTSKVKNTNSTTAGDVYDVTYINTMLGDIDTILTRLTTGSGV